MLRPLLEWERVARRQTLADWRFWLSITLAVVATVLLIRGFALAYVAIVVSACLYAAAWIDFHRLLPGAPEGLPGLWFLGPLFALPWLAVALMVDLFAT